MAPNHDGLGALYRVCLLCLSKVNDIYGKRCNLLIVIQQNIGIVSTAKGLLRLQLQYLASQKDPLRNVLTCVLSG